MKSKTKWKADDRTYYIGISGMSAELRDWIKDLADREKRSVSSQICVILQQAKDQIA